jgi:LPS-assembly protein
MSYNDKEGIYQADGDVLISKGEHSLHAQHARYNVKTEVVELWGDILFESGPDIIKGDRGIFDLKNKTGKIENGSLFMRRNNFYIRGASIEKTGEATYVFQKFELTTCEGDNPDWTITGSEASVEIEGYGQVWNAAFRIRGIPSLYLPYMIYPAKTKRQTGFLPPRAGFSSMNGVDIEVPFFWAISDQTDATFYQRYIQRRGYMQGLEFRYIADELSKGILMFDVISDRKEKDMDEDGDLEISPFSRTNKTRYWLRGMADQDLPTGIKARMDADYVSDQDYLNEFETSMVGLNARPELTDEFGRPVEEKKSPLRRSAIRVSRDGESYSLQALGAYHQRPENPRWDQTAQPFGGFDFSLLPTKVMGLPAFFIFDSEYDYVWREFGDRGHRTSLSPELRVPIWLGPYLVFEPKARYTYNFQLVDNEIIPDDHQNMHGYEVGASLSTSVYKTFDVDFPRAKRLKHKITPTISYNFRRHRAEWGYSPWFEKLEEEGTANRVAFTLTNFLDARLENSKGDVEYVQWVKLLLEQGYSIQEQRRRENLGRERTPMEPLRGELVFNPVKNIDFIAEAQYDHYQYDIISTDLSLDFFLERSGNKKDTLRIDYRYGEDDHETLTFNMALNLLYGFSVGGELERDLDSEQDVSSAVWLGYDRQCWGLRVVGEKADEKMSIMVVFKLLGLGELNLSK